MYSLLLLSALFFGVLGAAVGSFLNVVVYRTVRNQQWLMGRSECDHCGKPLAWFDNIPLLSFIWLRGKTRCCQKSLSLSHPTVELLSSALFVWWYLVGVFFIFRLTEHPYQILQPLFWLVVGVLLLGIVIADVSYFIIPDLFVTALTIFSLLYRFILTLAGKMRPQDLFSYVAVAGLCLVIFLVLWLITKRKGIGLGDVKFVFPMGLLLGWPRVVIGIVVAFLIGAVYGVVLVIFKGKKLQTAVPFGPFLIVGTLIALLWGYPLAEWYLHLLQ